MQRKELDKKMMKAKKAQDAFIRAGRLYKVAWDEFEEAMEKAFGDCMGD